MALTIHGDMARGAEGLTTIMNNHQTAMSKSMERVSTGLRINHSGDDAAGKAISERMATQIRALDQGQTNTQNANSLLSVADAAVSSAVEIIQKMRARALEAANDALDSDDRAVLQNELEQLRDQVINGSLAQHNGRHLLTGTYGALEDAVTYGTKDTNDALDYGKVYDTDTHEVYTYVLPDEYDGDMNKVYAYDTATGKYTIGTGETETGQTETALSFNDMSWDNSDENRSLHFQIGPDKGDVISTNLMDMSKIFDNVKIDVSSTKNAAETAKSLDTALTRALYQQAEIGTIQERLQYASENLQMTSDDTTEALSTIQDADLAKEMTNYVKNNILMQATQAMMAQANTSLATFIDLIKESRVS